MFNKEKIMSKNTISKEREVALQKLIVGHFIENIPEDCTKKVCYVLQGDGLWERRTNKLGTFTTPLHSFKVPGLSENYKEDWELNVPRIPADILVQIVSFFRKINRTYDSEVFVQVFYNFKEKTYTAHVPSQVVSGASVNYRNDNDFENNPDMLLVFEVHSHNTMGAFFSGTDDRDEKSDRFYGVVGRLNNYYPEMLIRLSVGGKRISVDVDEIFDLGGDQTFAEVFPAEWMSKVSKQQFKVRTYRGGKKIYVPTKSPYGEGIQMTLVGGGENVDDEMAEIDSNLSSSRESFYDWRDETFSNKNWDSLFDGVDNDTVNWRGKKF
jgi:PRTRC genetic system protein A